VSILGPAGNLEHTRLGGQIAGVIPCMDELPRLFEGLGGNADRVRSHVGDQSDGTLGADFDALVEFLRVHHRLFGRKMEPTR